MIYIGGGGLLSSPGTYKVQLPRGLVQEVILEFHRIWIHVERQIQHGNDRWSSVLQSRRPAVTINWANGTLCSPRLVRTGDHDRSFEREINGLCGSSLDRLGWGNISGVGTFSPCRTHTQAV